MSQKLRLFMMFFLTIAVVLASSKEAGADGDGKAVLVRSGNSRKIDSEVFSRLLSKARENGKVRVIVGLNIDFQPEGRHALSAAVAEQRNRIAALQESLLQTLPGPDTRQIKKFKYIPYVAMEAGESALGSLMNNPMVKNIEEDILSSPLLNQTIPLIGANSGEANSYTGLGQTIVIIDTGVDTSHPFLSGKVVDEACFSTEDPASGAESLCPNGLTEQTGSGAGINCPSDFPICYHGTHVAGIAAGKRMTGADGSIFRGVAPDANIISIQVFSKIYDASKCSSGTPCLIKSYTSDQLKALEKVYELRSSYPIAAVNMSMGDKSSMPSYCDTLSPSVKDSIDTLKTTNDSHSSGIATIISSGNEGHLAGINFPACISSSVSVGATMYLGISEKVADYSNSAAMLSLLAPGGTAEDDRCDSPFGILSSVPPEWGSWCTKIGTSMAAPHVAGAWALMKQRNPSASVDSILAAFRSTGVPITDRRIDSNRVAINRTKPRIKVDAALAALALPANLRPYQPEGWSDELVISTVAGSNSDSGVVYHTDSIYIDWAIENSSDQNIAEPFYTKLYVDGIVKKTWITRSLNAHYYVSVADYSIGSLSAGSHSIKIVTDAAAAITETSEADNEYSRTILVRQAGTGVNNCAADLSADLRLYLPIVIFGGDAYWFELSYVPNTPDFTLTNVGIVRDTKPFAACSPSTLSDDYKLHIPALSFGSSTYWVDFQYSHDLIFTLTNAGAN